MGELTREEKIKIFEENKKVVDVMAYKKYKHFEKIGYYDDIKQEGYTQLWKLINVKGIRCIGDERKYVHNMVWSAMGGYILRKIELDKRAKKNQDIEFLSLDYKVGKYKDVEVHDAVPSDIDIESIVCTKDEVNRLLEFAENVDKYSYNGKRKFKQILEMKMDGCSQDLIGKEIGCAQSVAGRRMKEIFSIIKDTFYNERICAI